MDAHEAAQMHQNFSQQLLQDHIAACSLPEHNLISVRLLSNISSRCHLDLDVQSAGDLLCYCVCVLQWTDGPPPVQIQAQNGPTTSLASLL